jgi:TRAP-type C4-dicarboxylate transport system permease small subunit
MPAVRSKIDWLLDALVMVTLTITIVSVVAQVIFRYILHNPLVGSEELAKLSFVWMIFLGAAVVTRDRLHIQVDFFFLKLPPALQRGVAVLMSLVTLALFCVVVVFGFQVVAAQSGMKSVGLNVPLAYYSFAVPIGSLFLIYYTLRGFRSAVPVASGEADR